MLLQWIIERANWYNVIFVHISNIKPVVSVYGSIKNRGNVLPVETCSAQICGFHIDHIAGSFSLIFAIVINIPFACCLAHSLGAGVQFQNPLEAISSFITISHSLLFPLAVHTRAAWAPSPVWPQRPPNRERCHLTELRYTQPSTSLRSPQDIKLSLITERGGWSECLKHIKGNQMSLMIGLETRDERNCDCCGKALNSAGDAAQL